MELFKKKISKTRLFLISSLVLFLVLIFAQLILVKPYKSKASSLSSIDLILEPTYVTATTGITFTVKFKVNPSIPIAIQLYKLFVTFDKTKLSAEKIEYLIPQPSLNLGADTDNNLNLVNQNGQIKIIGEITSPPEGKLLSGSSDLAIVTFKSLSSDLSGITVESTQSYLKEVLSDFSFGKIILNQAYLPVNGSTPPNPTSHVTYQPLGNVLIDLLLKFQGVNKPIESLAKMPVKITFVRPGTNVTKIIDFHYDNAGYWSAKGYFDLPEGTDYKVLVKGPKHLQKKVCHNQPTETFPGTYNCDQGEITIDDAATATIDFSSIYLLVGDLPNQDGVSNSYDSALVRNNLGNTDAESLRVSDLNLDGAVNAQDFSLVIAALSIRADEQ